MASEVLVPSSPAEAVELFGDGAGTTVIGGGTVVVPELTHGRLEPGPRAPALANAGLDGVSVDGDTITIGADRLDRRAPRPRRRRRSPPAPATSPTTRSAARRRSAATSAWAAITRRRAATCRAACSRSTRRCARRAPDGERTEPLEDFLARPAAGGSSSTSASSARPRRPSRRSSTPTRTSTPCSRSPVRARRDGKTRLAATGVAGPGPRLRVGRGAGLGSRGRRRRSGRRRHVRRRRARVRLVPRADAAGARPPCPHPTRGVRMNLTVNGVDTTIESGPLTSLLDVLREELGITSPKAGCEQGGCGACTVLVDGEPRRSCLTPVASVDGAAITHRRGPRLAGEHGADPAGVHAPLRRAVRLLHLRDDDGRAGLHRPRRQRRPRGHPGGARRPRLPLHGLRQDHRRGRGGGAGRVVRPHGHGGRHRDDEPGRCGMKAVGARVPRYDGVAHVTGHTRVRRRRPRSPARSG